MGILDNYIEGQLLYNEMISSTKIILARSKESE
jgi:hypothetical protein